MSLLTSIASALGFQSKRARLASADRGAVVGDLSLWNQSARIGGGITPQRISAIVRMADGGDMRQMMDLANECRQRDAHLQAVLATNEETIAALPWQLVGAEDERAKDRRAREWCERVLRQNPAFPRLIGSLAGAVYYAYAVNETFWEKQDGKLVPVDFKPLAPRRFGFRLEDGRFVWRDEGTDWKGIDFRAEHPHKFVVSQPRVTGDIPNREGLCRCLVWMSVFRNWVIADWLKTAETSWKPWRIGTYDKSTNAEEDKTTLEDVMRRLTTDGAAVLPKTMTIDVQWPQGTAGSRSTHAEFVNVLGMEMSKATLGQTETTQSSAASGFAQAKVHNEVRRDLREARACQIAADITRDLIASMIALNFGLDVAVPRLEFITQDAVDLKAFSEALGNLKNAGLRIPQAWAREQAGIPEPNEGEECLGDAEIPIDEQPPEDGNGNPDPSSSPPAKDETPADNGQPLRQAA